jgi:hypothetical protein
LGKIFEIDRENSGFLRKQLPFSKFWRHRWQSKLFWNTFWGKSASLCYALLSVVCFVPFDLSFSLRNAIVANHPCWKIEVERYKSSPPVAVGVVTNCASDITLSYHNLLRRTCHNTHCTDWVWSNGIFNGELHWLPIQTRMGLCEVLKLLSVGIGLKSLS